MRQSDVLSRRAAKKAPAPNPREEAASRISDEIRYSEECICFLLVRECEDVAEDVPSLARAGVFDAENYSSRVLRAIAPAFPTACNLASSRGELVSVYSLAECLPCEVRDEVYRELKWIADPDTNAPYPESMRLLAVKSILSCFRTLSRIRAEDSVSRALRDAHTLFASGEQSRALQIAADAIAKYNAAQSPDVSQQTLTYSFERYAEECEKQPERSAIQSGFETIDALTGGALFADGSLVFLGGAPGAGKTALATQMAINAARAGTPVMFFSCDMPARVIIPRAMSLVSAQRAVGAQQNPRNAAKALRESAVPVSALSPRGEKIPGIAEIIEESRAVSGVRVIAGEGMAATDISEAVMEQIDRTGIRPLVVVDYLQLLRRPADTRRGYDTRAEIEESIHVLRKLATKTLAPVLCISALSRVGYDKPISMEHFKETGDIEYAADVEIALQKSVVFPRRLPSGRLETREAVSARVAAHDADAAATERYCLSNREYLPFSRGVVAAILKNRRGTCGLASLEFFPNHMFFVDCGAFVPDKPSPS